MKTVHVKDGEDLSVIVDLEPSVSDPELNYPAVAQAYRVVANSFGPTLELVELKLHPTLLKDSR